MTLVCGEANGDPKKNGSPESESVVVFDAFWAIFNRNHSVTRGGAEGSAKAKNVR
jgi:hypothetical protein